MEKVVVAIPLYKTGLSDYEMLSLKRSLHMLGSHPITIICPQGLDFAPLQGLLNNIPHNILQFEDHYFKSASGYNALMLSEVFYNSLSNYEYVLICQTDVFVFEDRLEYWCNKGYDYIGAPWIASKQTPLKHLLLTLSNLFKKKKKTTAHFFRTGNGGFSLRRVATMQHIVSSQKENIAHLLQNPNIYSHQNEDIYFSLVAPLYTKMKIPDYVEAVDFAIDRKPDISLKLNHNKLPFACHRFYNKGVANFWLPIINSYTT